MDDDIKICRVKYECSINAQGYCDHEYICGCDHCQNYVKTYEEID